jgi:beta-phosphoglucomutase-like phosphatase (HAD superfamily)
MIKAIIFDFDGVVHDTFSFHLDKINQVLSEGTFTADEYKEVHMGNAHEREHLDEILIKKLQHIDWKKYEIFIYDEFINLVAEPEIKEALLLLSQTKLELKLLLLIVAITKEKYSKKAIQLQLLLISPLLLM